MLRSTHHIEQIDIAEIRGNTANTLGGQRARSFAHGTDLRRSKCTDGRDEEGYTKKMRCQGLWCDSNKRQTQIRSETRSTKETRYKVKRHSASRAPRREVAPCFARHASPAWTRGTQCRTCACTSGSSVRAGVGRTAQSRPDTRATL